MFNPFTETAEGDPADADLVEWMAWMFVVGVAVADEPRAEANKAAVAKALETFAGAWKIAAVQPEGATKGARRLVFHKDGTYAAQDKDGKELWAGTFEIDPTASPKVWDHRSHDARKEGKDVLGIYVLDGDTLKVTCVVLQSQYFSGSPL